MKKWGIMIPSLLMILILSGCGCEHEWVEANCTTPKTCSLCDEVEGEPLGHQYLEANCSAPKTCSICEVTEGDPLPHTPGDFVTKTDLIRAAAITTQSCTLCDEVLSTSEEPISLIKDGFFLLSAEDFVARMNYIFEQTGKSDWFAELVTAETDGTVFFGAVVYNEDQPFADILFHTPDYNSEDPNDTVRVTETQKSERIICKYKIVINFYHPLNYLYDEEIVTRDEAEPGDTDAYVNEFLDMIGPYTEHGEELYMQILPPVYLTLDPALTEDEVTDAIHRSWEYIYVFLDASRISYSDTCGTLSTEYSNFFLLNYTHIIAINASSELD